MGDPRDPTFSVIIPTFQRLALLSRAVTSVLNQTFDSLEIVVVDDNSTSHECIALWVRNCPHVRVITLDENMGPGAARNAGIHAARGTYIAFLDDDDEFHPDFLRTSLSIHQQFNGRRIVTCARVSSSATSYCEPASGPTAHLISPDEFTAKGTGHGIVIKRAHLLPSNLFAAKFRVVEDTDFFYRLIQDGIEPVEICHLPIIIHEHEGSRLTDNEFAGQRLSECEALVEAHNTFLESHPAIKEQLTRAIRKLSALVGSPPT